MRVFTWDGGDVPVDSRDNPTMVQITLKKSKTDQCGKTGMDICPVAAILNYIVVQAINPRTILRNARWPSNGQTEFRDRSLEGNSKAKVINGLPADQYTGHSFHYKWPLTLGELTPSGGSQECPQEIFIP